MSRSRIVAPLLATLLLATAAGAQRTAPAQVDTSRAAPLSAPLTDIRYEVTFTEATARGRTIRVAMSFGTAGTAPVLLSLPAWTPGAYEISNFARWVTDFGATGDGKPLGWDKLDFDTWRIQPAGAKAVTVSFEVLADSLDNAMAWARQDFAMFNGTTLFMYPEGRCCDFASRVAVRTEPAWLIGTGMEPGPARGAFTASSFHDLVDMPFFVGRFDLDSAQIAGKWMRLATYPAGSVSGEARQATWEQLRKMTPPQAAVFGEVPWRTYTVMQIADSAYGGLSGLEHQSSHVDIVTPLAIGTLFLASLYSHEIFHAWNVKRLRPAELWPYRYDRPQPTTLLWVSEGITSYYGDLMLVRGGLVGNEELYQSIAAKINEVNDAPPTALEDASLNTWVSPADGTHYLYYSKGALAGLLLDIMIRDASDNRRSLDDVMRGLYQSTYKQGRGFTTEDWWRAVSAAANGRPFDEFQRRYVDGRDPYPWTTALPLAGLRIESDTIRQPRIGVFTAQDTAGVRVTAIEPGSAAEKAGVRTGDILTSVGDIPVNDASFGERFRERYGKGDGTTVTLSVRRAGKVLSLNAPLQYVTRVESRIAEDPSAPTKAVRIRNGILKGTVDR